MDEEKILSEFIRKTGGQGQSREPASEEEVPEQSLQSPPNGSEENPPRQRTQSNPGLEERVAQLEQMLEQQSRVIREKDEENESLREELRGANSRLAAISRRKSSSAGENEQNSKGGNTGENTGRERVEDIEQEDQDQGEAAEELLKRAIQEGAGGNSGNNLGNSGGQPTGQLGGFGALLALIQSLTPVVQEGIRARAMSKRGGQVDPNTMLQKQIEPWFGVLGSLQSFAQNLNNNAINTYDQALRRAFDIFNVLPPNVREALAKQEIKSKEGRGLPTTMRFPGTGQPEQGQSGQGKKRGRKPKQEGFIK